MARAHTDCRSSSKFTQVRREARLAPALRGEEFFYFSCAHFAFNLSSTRGLNTFFTIDSPMSAVTDAPNFIGRLSDSALSGLEGAQACQRHVRHEARLRWRRGRCWLPVAAVCRLKTEVMRHCSVNHSIPTSPTRQFIVL